MIIPKPKYKIGDELWTWWFDKTVDVLVVDVEFVYNYKDKTKTIQYYCLLDKGMITIDVDEEELYRNKEDVEEWCEE